MPLQSNGLPSAQQDSKQVSEYKRILRVHDEIFAGTHPRLTLSSNAPRNVTSYTASSPQKPLSQSNGVHVSAPSNSHASENALNKSPSKAKSSAQSLSTQSTSTRQFSSAQNGSVGLDPIFLTKSDDLIRAEMKLERQRIERALEEQVQQRRLGTRQRISEQEALPDFDVSEVLQQAQELVKPILAADTSGANGAASSSDSFDDNTFYSSQMNDSAVEDLDEPMKRRKTRPCKYFFEGSCRKGDTCIYSHDSAFKQQLQAGGSLTMELDNSDTVRDMETLPSNGRIHYGALAGDNRYLSDTEYERGRTSKGHVSGKSLGQANNGSRAMQNPRAEAARVAREMQHGPREENDHSMVSRADYNEHHQQVVQPQYETHSPNRYARPDLATRRAERRSSLPRNVQVVRNHITSPVAPQPARVSPLAVAKVPRLEQVRRIDHNECSPRSTGLSSAMQKSPADTTQPANSRKRRREPDSIDLTRNVSSRRLLDSPGPYIKEEPISPPPFSAYPSRQYLQEDSVGRQPRFVEITSPRHREPVVYRRNNLDESISESLNAPRVATPVIRHVVSRGGEGSEPRQGLDRRRIVSARQPRRMVSPQQDVERHSAHHPRSARAISHSYAIRPDVEQQRDHRASVQPLPLTYARPDLSPELRHIPYSPIERDVQPMAPPPRRIVVDQYGNKYYEAPLPQERMVSVVPALPRSQSRAATQSFDPPRATEGSFQRNAPRVVSTSQLAQPYKPLNYTQRLVSPEPPSPRYIEYYDAAEHVRMPSQQTVYEPREEVYRDRNGLVRVVDYGQDERAPRLEELPRAASRMQSVRPSVAQYEAPREYPARMQTVQPEHERMMDAGGLREVRPPTFRQMSLRADDRYERAPTYVTSERRPRYQYVANPQDRFVDVGMEGDRIMMEAPRDGRVQPLQRL